MDWDQRYPGSRLYLFPPVYLALRAVKKVLAGSNEAIVVLPDWMSTGALGLLLVDGTHFIQRVRDWIRLTRGVDIILGPAARPDFLMAPLKGRLDCFLAVHLSPKGVQNPRMTFCLGSGDRTEDLGCTATCRPELIATTGRKRDRIGPT